MKIAVIGAGSIGCLVAGYLKLKEEEVTLVGRPDSVKAIKESGLQISGCRGDSLIEIGISERLDYKPDLAILATKTQDVEQAIKDNLSLLSDALILTTQNGMHADDISAGLLRKENILSSIVMFGSTYLTPGKIVHNFEGSWIIGNIFSGNDDRVIKVSHILNKIFPTIVAENLKGMKLLKVFVNANNCIPAILGQSMQESFKDTEVCRISINIWKEGLGVVAKSGIELVSLPDFPLERMTKLSSMPTVEAARIFSSIMGNLSKEPLYGSILQSIKRGRPSEIDYINGEFVALARASGSKAPLNEMLVEMVHNVEKTKRFYSSRELIESTKELIV